MNVHRILLLGALILLGACKEERLVLHFEQPVASGWGLDSQYQQAILDGLQNAGIDSSQATLDTRDNGKAVAVSFPEDALSQQQQTSLTTYFDDLLKARAEAQQVRLRIKQQEPEVVKGDPFADTIRMLQAKANTMRLQFTSRIEYFDTPRLMYQEREAPGVRVYQSSPVHCQVTLGLEKPLPQIHYQLNAPGESGSVDMLNPFLATQSLRLPSSVSIGNSDLDKAVAEGHYRYKLITSANARANQADELVFFFGELGLIDHRGGLTTTDLGKFEANCLKRIMAAGRPFTFHYGNSLDRLIAVDYRFGETAR